MENIQIALFLFLFLLLVSENRLTDIEKNWKKIVEDIYDYDYNDDDDDDNDSKTTNESNADPLSALNDFAALDGSILQVLDDTNTTFEDVAGNEQAKEELVEIVKFLKNPETFTRLGATLPKGVLLGGPPGTGKTLLAKALAGEANVPFLKISGSQFVELLIGVGAARVRELFETARALKPSIIFIDEIDSIARVRSGNTSMGGVNDEREQTLNQLLTEMDGFEEDTGIIVIAATNRIDVLDPAIRRPGRFDRQIIIGNPNFKERLSILKVHARGKKFDSSVSLSLIAQRTIGFSGADLCNILNEAAILATRRKKLSVTMTDISDSIARLVLGLEGKPMTRIKARQLTAFHEMGHAFMSTLINDEEEVDRISLIPRGNTQGITWMTPSLSEYNSRISFINKIIVALSGRAAEEMINGNAEFTVGAEQDLGEMTRILRTMVLRYALVQLQELKQEAQQRNLYLLGSDIKQELNNMIDNFMTNFIDITYNQVLSLLEFIRPCGERLVDELLINEEITGNDLRAIAEEYLSILSYSDILRNLQETAIFNLLMPELIERKLESTNLEKNITTLENLINQENLIELKNLIDLESLKRL